jgi:hypothetical protein
MQAKRRESVSAPFACVKALAVDEVFQNSAATLVHAATQVAGSGLRPGRAGGPPVAASVLAEEQVEALS